MLNKKYKNFVIKGLFASLVFHASPIFAKTTLPVQDYVNTIRNMDFYSNQIDNLFLTTLAKEYKSYALFKANYTPDYANANHFAVKALGAFHGEYVRPENIYKRNLPPQSIVEISNYYDSLRHLLRTDLIFQYPQLMAEAQAKFDCWVDSEANGLSRAQSASCQSRFMKAHKHLLAKLEDSQICNCKKKNKKTTITTKKTLSKYNGQILPMPKWPNLPAITNNPPIPVVRHTVVKELTISKEIQNAIVKIEQTIKEINAKLADNKKTSSTDVQNLKKQLADIKLLLASSKDESIAALQKKILDLESQLANISCNDSNLNEPTSDTPSSIIPPFEEEEEEETEENNSPEDTADSEEEEKDTDTEETEDTPDKSEEQEEVIEESSEDTPSDEESSDESVEEESEEEEDTDDTLDNEEIDDSEEDEEEEDADDEDPEEFAIVGDAAIIEIEISNAPSQHLPFEVMFDWNSAEVKPAFLPQLKDIAENALSSKELIIIKGHTDASGSAEYNKKLSKKRAENVGKIIMSYGIPKEKIVLQGVGSTEPKVKTKAGEKNAQNRRVVIN